MSCESYSEENRPLAEVVRDAVADALPSQGVELVDLSFRREGSRMVLRLLVDKPGGITVDECTHLNQMIGEILDREDLIHDRYTLEVSSPGLDRPLVTKRDFERNIGRKVKITMDKALIDREKIEEGKLCQVDDENIVIVGKNGTSKIIPLKGIKKAILEVEF